MALLAAGRGRLLGQRPGHRDRHAGQGRRRRSARRRPVPGAACRSFAITGVQLETDSRRRLRHGRRRQPLGDRPEAPDRSSASRARAAEDRRRRPRDRRRAARRRRQAARVHRLLHRQPEGRELQLLGAADRAGGATDDRPHRSPRPPRSGPGRAVRAAAARRSPATSATAWQCGARRARGAAAVPATILAAGAAAPPRRRPSPPRRRARAARRRRAAANAGLSPASACLLLALLRRAC